MVLPEGLDLRKLGVTYVEETIFCGESHSFNGLQVAIKN